MLYWSRKWYYWIEAVSHYWKISELANRIINNGVDHGYYSPEIEISYGGKTYEIDILKFNCSKSVDWIFQSLSEEKKICSYLLTLQRSV